MTSLDQLETDVRMASIDLSAALRRAGINPLKGRIGEALNDIDQEFERRRAEASVGAAAGVCLHRGEAG